MKTIALFTLCSMLTLGSMGQTNTDGVFNSPNDYKHPHSTSKQPGDFSNVTYVEPSGGAGNYKQQNKNIATKLEGILIKLDKKEEKYNALNNSANYKTQRK
jgi:hypothetical protein